MDPGRTGSTSDPTPKPQMVELQSSLDALRAELAGVESLMSVLRSRMSSIQQAIDKLNTGDLSVPPPDFPIMVGSQRPTNFTGFVNLLPADVLILIWQDAMFGMVTDDKPNNELGYVELFRKPTAPWTYASVCKHWRAACLSRPSLWTRITYWEIPGRYPKLAAFQRHRITTQLRRSANIPLIGWLSGVEPRIDVDPPEEELSLLRQIITAFPRFISLELHGEMPLEVLPSSPVTFDLLQSLLVDGRWWIDNSGIFPQKTPKLKTLTLCGMPAVHDIDLNVGDPPPYHPSVSFACITTLDISETGMEAIRFQDMACMLRACAPCLSSLYIEPSCICYDGLEDRWSQPSPEFITLPSLRHLRITTTDFLKWLRAPSLSILETGNIRGMTLGSNVINFILDSKSGGCLTSLTINVSDGYSYYDTGVPGSSAQSMEDIGTLLSLLPALQYLRIRGMLPRSFVFPGQPLPDSISVALLQSLTLALPSDDHPPAGRHERRNSGLVP